MKKEPETKKLLCALSKDRRSDTGAEHLVPCLGQERPVFIGTKTGREYPEGYVCYLGKAVTVSDILSKLDLPEREANAARERLVAYLGRLKEFKIGNVLSISWGAGGELELNKEAERPNADTEAKLP